MAYKGRGSKDEEEEGVATVSDDALTEVLGENEDEDEKDDDLMGVSVRRSLGNKLFAQSGLGRFFFIPMPRSLVVVKERSKM